MRGRVSKPAPDSIQLNSALAETHAAMADALERKNRATELLDDLLDRAVKFEIADSVFFIEGDARLLRSVLENLLGNAGKYSRIETTRRESSSALPHTIT